tara:strand:+ start:145 stop:2421 length:2277 start_codon:yes stop_codon:yes gene_type:complete
VAALQKTYSGDLSEFIAGKIWSEVKRRNDEAEIEKREGDPLVKKAAKELLKDDDKSTPVVDKPLRESVSKIFGGGIDVKLISLEGKADKLSDSINTIVAGIADTQKLIVNQNEILESKFDELLTVFGKKTKEEKDAIEAEKFRQLELDLEEKKLSSKVNDIIGLGLPGGASGDLSIWFARMLMKGGGSLTRRLFNRFASRRLRRRTAVTLGKLSPNRWKAKGLQYLSRRLPGGRTITNRITREVAERTAIRTTGKVGTKVGLKKFPVVSIAAGTLFAIERALKGDAEGAALEFVSGLAGTVPGKGTALSFLIDGILLNRDIRRANKPGYEKGYESGKNRGKIDPGAPWHGTEAGLTKNTLGDIMNTFTKSIVSAGTLLISAAVGYGDAIGMGREARSAVVDNGLGHYKLEPIPFYTNVGDVGAVDSLGNTIQSKMKVNLPDLALKEQEGEKISEDDQRILDEKKIQDGRWPTDLRRHFNFGNSPDNKGSSNETSNNIKLNSAWSGPPSQFEQKPDFGDRVAFRNFEPHEGEDYPMEQGTSIVMLKGGTVNSQYYAKENPNNSDLAEVLIDHPDGTSTRYLHLSKVLVEPGQTVSPGDVIGLTGGAPGTPGAGRSDGPHLHLEFYPTPTSSYVNPLDYNMDEYFKFEHRVGGVMGGGAEKIGKVDKSVKVDNITTNESSNISSDISHVDWSPPSFTKNEVAHTVQQGSSSIHHVKRSMRKRSSVFYVINNIDNSTAISFGSGRSSSGTTLQDIHLARLG